MTNLARFGNSRQAGLAKHRWGGRATISRPSFSVCFLRHVFCRFGGSCDSCGLSSQDSDIRLRNICGCFSEICGDCHLPL